MDLETENRLAAMLMREAADLRRQAEKEGVLAYLRQPNARARPNSRFLTATVLGVQQANRSVEVKEMWRVREKEKELNKRLKDTSRDKSSGDRRTHEHDNSDRSIVRHGIVDNNENVSASFSSKREHEDHHPEGLTNEELDKFLHSRKKRGRGDIGARMDETGPYLPPCSEEERATSHDAQKNCVIYGPEKPSSLKSFESSEDELEKSRKKAKKTRSGSSDKKHRRKEGSKHKKKKGKEKSRHRQ